ncbi:MAG: hypothetical protein N4A49_14830 [Marinifilaceae bacterium]|jgi:hypothetical protein|nr:hypothetical protein [Marinifilaceae bacterium]
MKLQKAKNIRWILVLFILCTFTVFNKIEAKMPPPQAKPYRVKTIKLTKGFGTQDIFYYRYSYKNNKINTISVFKLVNGKEVLYRKANIGIHHRLKWYTSVNYEFYHKVNFKKFKRTFHYSQLTGKKGSFCTVNIDAKRLQTEASFKKNGLVSFVHKQNGSPEVEEKGSNYVREFEIENGKYKSGLQLRTDHQRRFRKFLYKYTNNKITGIYRSERLVKEYDRGNNIYNFKDFYEIEYQNNKPIKINCYKTNGVNNIIKNSKKTISKFEYDSQARLKSYVNTKNTKFEFIYESGKGDADIYDGFENCYSEFYPVFITNDLPIILDFYDYTNVYSI